MCICRFCLHKGISDVLVEALAPSLANVLLERCWGSELLSDTEEASANLALLCSCKML